MFCLTGRRGQNKNKTLKITLNRNLFHPVQKDGPATPLTTLLTPGPPENRQSAFCT